MAAIIYDYAHSSPQTNTSKKSSSSSFIDDEDYIFIYNYIFIVILLCPQNRDIGFFNGFQVFNHFYRCP